jgi:methionine biosynthesis protein MetW
MMARREGLYAERFNIGGVGEERIVACIELFKELHGDRLLDIGCGDGAVTVQLMQSMGAREASGVEIVPKAVSAASRRGINASCLDIDSEDLPFEDSSFDVVYCGEIIEHVFDPDHLLIQVRRVLRRGGLCVLTTPNLAGWPNRLALFLGSQPYPMAVSPNHEGAGKLFLSGEEGQWGHIRVFTLRALKELIRGHGFAILRVKGCPVTIKSTHVLIRPIRLLDRWLARFPSLANRVILVLRKT